MILKLTGSEVGYTHEIGGLFNRDTVLSAHWRPTYITWSDRIIMTDVSKVPHYCKSGAKTIIQLDHTTFCTKESVNQILNQVKSGGYATVASTLGQRLPRRLSQDSSGAT